MKNPHKHAELIKAWADGAKIQLNDDGFWIDVEPYGWDVDLEYRIKPQLKRDVVRWVWATTQIGEADFEDFEKSPNLKLTIDGETGKLKSAEVL